MVLLYVSKNSSSIWSSVLIAEGDFFLISLIKKNSQNAVLQKRILCIAVVKLISYFQSWSKELKHLGYIFKMLLPLPNV